MLVIPQAFADDDKEEEKEISTVQRLVDAVGATIYAAAWPTATYRKMSFKGIERVKEGYAAKVQLTGTSSRCASLCYSRAGG